MKQSLPSPAFPPTRRRASAGLDALGFVGTSFQRLGFERLGRLVLSPGDVAARRALRAALGADELVYLATCNRVECYVALPEPVVPEALRERFVAFAEARGEPLGLEDLEARTGVAAARWAFEVASSLHSLVVGETEIAGQMRRANEEAREAGLSGDLLWRLHESVQACARRVRNETRISALAVSVGTLAVKKTLQCFGKQGPRRSVLVGAGLMTVKAARVLSAFPGELLFVNRTLGKAEDLAARFGGRACSLADFLAAPPEDIDLLFAATSAPEPIITTDCLRPAAVRRANAGGGPLVVCDLGVPRDVEGTAGDLPGVRLVDMNAVERLSRLRREELAGEQDRARELVADAVGRYERERRFAALAERSAQAFCRSNLAHLAPDERALVERFARQLGERLARQPAKLA
ncbi:MAG: hypothetical protein D6731_11105 [Planctomycetota bacterium]|nr:MAG: hypothetical protein D6731_11105 [Planctomycetota bacterium]